MKLASESDVRAALRGLPGPSPRVVVGGNFATPWALVAMLESTLEHCRAFVLNPQAGWPQRTGFVTETPFVGPGARHDDGLDFLPMRLSLVPRLYSTLRPPNAVLVQTSTPRDGRVSLGVEVNILPAAIEAVRASGGVVIAQLNAQMPYTLGDGEIDVTDIDLGFEMDAPLASPSVTPVDDDARAIGELVAYLATDGCTVQSGIGDLPDSALSQMVARRHLGVWSELVGDGVLNLERAGALDPSRPIVTTFLFGSAELYRWANENPRLCLRRTEVVNDPSRIAAQPKMLSVNAALQVDLFAQANASYVHHRIYSGFGGQPDFVSGALHSPGGHAVIALRSWHDKSGSSNIVPLIEDPACSFQHSVIVTEQGMAAIFGHSQRAQARLLIEETAHPRAQGELWAAAERFGLVRDE